MKRLFGPAARVLGATLLWTGAVRAQEPAGRCDTSDVVDRVVAVVGEAPILSSQVEEEAYQQRTQGLRIPDSAGALQVFCRQVIAQIIDVELLVQQAERDTSIKVTDQEIADGVEQQVRNVRGRFTSEVDYRAELRKAGFQTPEEYRRWLKDQQRRAALQNRLLDKLRTEKKLAPVIPTEREMRDYFELQKAQLGSRPATLSFRQLVIAPQPSEAAKAVSRALADSIVLELRQGAEFTTAARRFSQDPGSKDQGGDLNWFRRGVMLPAFESAAFSLKPGVISDPVETAFGFHIIQVQRVQPGEVQARHILLMPEVTAADADSAARLAATLRQAVVDGAPMDSLRRLYHDPELDKDAEEVPLTKMHPEYAAAIGDADSGAVVPLFQLAGPTELRKKYVILQVTGRRPEGEVRFEDVRDQVRERLSQELAVRRYLDRLRHATYVEIRS